MDNSDGFGTVSAFMAGTAAINAVAAISKKHDPTPLLFATAGLYSLFLIIGLFTRWEWVKPFAGIVFLLAVLSNGFPLLDSMMKLVQGLQLKATQTKTTAAQAQAPIGLGVGM